MNRRLRKKLHRGEFNQLGFGIRCVFDPPLREDTLWDTLIPFVESHDLAVGGGMGATSLDLHVTRVRRVRRIGADRYRWAAADCTETDRGLLRDHLAALGAKSLEIDTLSGAWS